MHKTIDLNKTSKIKVIKCCVSNHSSKALLLKNQWGNASDKLSLNIQEKINQPSYDVNTITVDDFVRQNKLRKVDFIKCDIEGHERFMLEGAQETLKKFAPKLAICTYHYPDDPEVLEELILRANPLYKIVHLRHKLFAAIPN